MPNTNFWYNEMLYKIIIHEKSSPKMSDISCHVLHDVWPQKAFGFCEISFTKTLPIISKLYASASVHQWIIYGSLWGPPGHGSIAILKLGYALRRYYVTNLTRIWRQLSQF